MTHSCFMQLLSFVGTWSYAGSLSRLFFLTLTTRFLSITIGLPLILLVMLRLFKRIMFSSLKLLSWNLSIVPAHCCHFLFVTFSSAIVSSVIWDIKEFLFLKILWESPGSSTWRSPHWFCHGYSWVNSSFRSGISILWAYGFWYGNLILAFFAQDGHADQVNDRKVCPVAVTACVFIFSSEK